MEILHEYAFIMARNGLKDICQGEITLICLLTLIILLRYMKALPYFSIRSKENVFSSCWLHLGHTLPIQDYF